MNSKEVNELAQAGRFKGYQLEGEVLETHISWIILSGDFAFKIKKPLKLSFLDYSTLALRKKYCQLELELNGRFSDIYLSVEELRKKEGVWIVGGGEGELMDYAVCMKRLPSERRMDKLLAAGEVGEKDIRELAETVAAFHQKQEAVNPSFDLEKAKALFNDITSVADALEESVGKKAVKNLREIITWSDRFLEANAERFSERIADGFVRDLHGDLHAGNVFLMDQPVLFDCIEFNAEIRTTDILYELAFLSMDLEKFGQNDHARLFLVHYNQIFPVIFNQQDKEIFNYFKCLRANIRVKVLTIKGQQSAGMDAENTKEIGEYLNLMSKYVE
ncbi:MAG: phosphotransferase [Cyclobacteriaceae bacterium]